MVCGRKQTEGTLDGSKKPIVIFEFDKKLEEFKGKVNNHA